MPLSQALPDHKPLLSPHRCRYSVAGMGRTPTKSAGEQFPASKAPSDAAEPQTCPLPGLELMQKAAEPHELEPLKHYVDQWLAESLPSADKDPQDGTQEQGPRGEADAMVTGAGQPLLNSTQAPLLPVQPASHAMTTAPSFPPQPSQPVSDAQTVREAASTAASPALDPLAAANAVETKGAPLRQDAEPGSTTITAADVESTPAELGRAQDAARSSTTGVQHAPQPEQTVNRGDSWWGRFTRRYSCCALLVNVAAVVCFCLILALVIISHTASSSSRAATFGMSSMGLWLALVRSCLGDPRMHDPRRESP